MTAPQLPPGHVVAGKYSIVGVLGYGGTAATYRAAGADARAFAVKIFDPALAQRSDVMASLEQVYGASNALPGTDAARIIDAVREIQKRIGNKDPIEVVPWARGYQEVQADPKVIAAYLGGDHAEAAHAEG